MKNSIADELKVKKLSPVAQNNLRRYIPTANALAADSIYSIIQGKVKYTDLEILCFFIDELDTLFLERNPKKVNMLNRYCTLVGGWTGHIYEGKDCIDSVIAKKIFTFPKLYEEFCNACTIEPNEEFVKSLDEIIEFIKDSFPEEESSLEEHEPEIKTDNCSEELDKLNIKIKELEKELEVAKKENGNLKSTKTRNARKIERLETDIQNLKLAIKEFKDTTKKLEKDLSSSEKTNETINAKLVHAEAVLNDTTRVKDAEISELKKKVLDSEKALLQSSSSIEQIRGTQVINQEVLDNKVLAMLLNSRMTTKEIYYTLISEKFDVKDVRDVIDSLKRIQARYSITQITNLSFGEPSYLLQQPFVDHGKTCFFPVDDCKNQLDILIYSDLHLSLTEGNNNSYKKLEKIYDYAKENGIKYVLNLGDTIDGYVSSADKTLEILKRNEDFLASLISKEKHDWFPEDFNFGILGGNHDYAFASYGIDPVQYIASNTTNVINLGYNYANLKFGSADNREYIALHHAGIPADSKVPNIFNQGNETASFLKSKHTDTENMFWAFFGHHHRSMLVYEERFCSVASACRDRSCDGACHVKICFNKDNKITSMDIINLSLGSKRLAPTNEIAVQRKRS